ncbi:carbamoyltransferase HypF [Lachnospiraceae bacterium C1.1]|nr:carbamoyltransferase HypF [Lachnospiraceae bacterium C1.1]
MEIRTQLIRVYGIVQGVGFRPTAARLAEKHNIKGSVSNRGPYVEIYARGSERELREFKKDLEENPPERSVILRIETEETDNGLEYDDFRIIESEKTSGEIFIPPDIAICDKCSEELFDKENRRYLHPFINCTQCGPRLTIIDNLPYDRCRTSMKKFPMCPDCAEEYENPESRRYDAQPVCCNDCGPKLYTVSKDSNERKEGLEAISLTRKIISEGGIAAIKGIGGFHLCCDAFNEKAVMLLRERKKRPVKPFAVMLKDKEAVKRESKLEEDSEELKIISGHQKPIMLVEKSADSKLAESVAPGSRKLGIMLPYAPVQLLLFSLDDGIKMPDALVMTSGNVSGAPICHTDEEALSEIAGFCDIILSNDRDIRTRADDSVMESYKGEPYMIRRSRGYAPLPFYISGNFDKNILAVGGELKNSFCIAKGNLIYPSAYIGDLADIRSQQALKETIERMEAMLEADCDTVVCDLHPGYNSTNIAESMGKKLIRVQHHYTHILSCMAENDQRDDVIGASFDGTGYGTDGTIWGGEIMRAGTEGFERLFSIKPFIHVGGDSASKEGWKIAVSMLDSLIGDEKSMISLAEETGLAKSSEALVISRMKKNGLNSIKSSSMGRLFDAVSALLGIVRKSTFEGEASMALQAAAENYEEKFKNSKEPGQNFKKYELKTDGEGLGILPTDELFYDIFELRKNGADIEKTAYFFHASLAKMTAEAICRAGEEKGITTAALSGGVFQNLLLLKLVEEEIEKRNFRLLRHSLVAPNDGGIALGQAFAAMHRID